MSGHQNWCVLVAAQLQLVNIGPDQLPPTSPLDLRRAWRAAHMGAEVGLALEPSDMAGIRFAPPDRAELRFLFADLDAACWAAAVDRTFGLDTMNGVSLLFRLLALINLMSEARWLQPYFSLSKRDGAELAPELLATAATQPLTRAAQFQPTAFKRALGVGKSITPKTTRPALAQKSSGRGKREER